MLTLHCPRCGTTFTDISGQGAAFAALSGSGQLALLVGCGQCGLLFAPAVADLTPPSDGATSVRYVDEKPLGRGGMGATSLARDTVTGRLVCLKRLHPTVDVASIRHEWKALTRLDHPSIVRLLDFVDTGAFPLLVMEFIDGVSLKAHLAERGPLPEPTALDCARQLCQALHYAHEHEVIHRDIKPDNIIVTADGPRLVPHILDFGIAIVDQLDARDASTAEGNFAGTALYAAPEQLHAARLTPAVDVYAVGLTLAETLVGNHPHGHLPVPSLLTLKATVNGLDLPEHVGSAATRELVRALTQRNPAHRPTSAEAALRIDALLSVPSAEAARTEVEDLSEWNHPTDNLRWLPSSRCAPDVTD